MSLPSLFPDPEELLLDSVIVDTDAITIHAATQRTAVPCPSCDTLTNRVHSHYGRTLRDLPWQGTPVRIWLRTRRFFCEVETCPRRIFTERLPQTTTSYARSTLRFSSALRTIALALGGEGGRHLSQGLAMPASGDTLLRRLRQEACAPRPIPSPRVLGVDEWAWKKGHRYGTILVDLERGSVVDLLPDRSADSFANWLRERPSVEVISRDRSSLYAEGATRGAPNAVQVADRWHLLRNLTDAVERILEGRATLLREAAALLVAASPEERAPTASPPIPPLSRAEQAKATRRVQRLARYQEAVDRRQRGQALRAVAREVGVNVRTIRRWLRAEGFPERKEAPARASKLDAYRSYLDARFQQGCTNAAGLWRELRDRGFQGGVSIVRAYVGSLRSGSSGPANRSKKPPTLRQTAWLLVLSETEMKPEQHAYMEALMGLSPELARLRELVQAFRHMLREHDVSAFEAWIESAEASLLRSFARSLRTDLAAVRAAVELPWSNGQTEGQVNRLKLIKRSMYGRAGFDLLRERVLFAA